MAIGRVVDRETRKRTAGAGLIAVLLCAGMLGCGTTPTGPAFAYAPEPAAERARLYVFRNDPRSSLARIKVQVDGRRVGLLRDREYQTREIRPGPHRLRTEMQGVPFVPMGWNTHDFEAAPGETIYLEVELRTESRQASPRSVEISGRSNDVVTKNVYIRELKRHEAEPELSKTHLAVSSPR